MQRQNERQKREREREQRIESAPVLGLIRKECDNYRVKSTGLGNRAVNYRGKRKEPWACSFLPYGDFLQSNREGRNGDRQK